MEQIDNMKKQLKKNISDLIELGELQQAKELMHQYEQSVSSDVDIYSIKATILLIENKLTEAKRILLEALNIDERNFDINYNLAYTYENLEEYKKALEYYKKSLTYCDNKNMKNDIITAIEKISSNHSIIKERSRDKLAFFVKQGMDSFLEDVIKGLSDEYETKKIIVTDLKQIDDGMQWADICWFEWCDELVAYGSKHRLAVEKKIICRLHRYEALTSYPKNVEWNNVDKLVIVTDHLRKFLVSQIHDIEVKVDIITIKNGVNLSKYKFQERNQGFNIAYVGYIHQRKNPVLLLQIISKLVKKDRRYKLYVAGQFQDGLVELYWNHQIQQMGLRNNVIFEGWQKNISKWLEDKNYILSSSMHESFGYGIAEAMARGIKPVIHNFIFAEEIWNEKYLFNTIDEAVSMISEKSYNSQHYRRFIEENYSLESQIENISEIINESKNRQYLSKIQNDKITLDYVYKKINEFIGYKIQNFDNYDFESADIIIGKREKINDLYEMIEFILKNKKNKQLVINNVWYDISHKNIIFSEPIQSSRNLNLIAKFVNRIIELKVEFVNNIAGFIFDKEIIEDINKNALVYNWERAIPASQFMPMMGYLRIAERYIFARKFINKNDKVLESPCGFGYGAAYFSGICSHVEALDIAEDNIEFGKEAYGFDNINWINGDVTNLPYKDNEFDVYVSYEVFEHLPIDLIDKYLNETRRVLKENGKFIISTPNREMRKHINNPFHIKEYNFEEYRNILEKYYTKIKYYSVSNYKVNNDMQPNAFSMIAVCEK